MKVHIGSVITYLTIVVMTTILIILSTMTGRFASAADFDAFVMSGPERTTVGVTPSEPTSAPEGVDVSVFGADGTDEVDDTAAIQAALNASNSVYIPNGIYYITVSQPLTLRSGQILTLESDAELRALASVNDLYSVVKISNVSNVMVTGGTIVGDRDTHIGTTGEWGMGILIDNGAEDICISGVTVRDCWGDGIYLGGEQTVQHITLEDITCDNNRRQGLSITNAAYVTVRDSVFKNTNGTAPSAGIDIEPNQGASFITISGSQCIGNEGSGLDIMGLNTRIDNITVSHCVFSGNNGAGIVVVNAAELRISDTIVENNHTGIEIKRDTFDLTFTNMTVSGNQQRGVSLVTSAQNVGTAEIAFNSCTFIGNSTNLANQADGIRIDQYDSTGFIRDVTFTHCRFLDEQTVKTQRFGLTVGFAQGLSRIVVDSSSFFDGNISGSFYGGEALTLA